MSTGRRVVVPLCSRGTNHRAHVSLNPQTIAFMELLKVEDSKQMKDKWRCFGFKDVTPLWGSTPDVKTFNQAAPLKRWSEYQSTLREIDADWYYLSGHHATKYYADQALPPDTDTDAGFFNEPYHDGPWARGPRTPYLEDQHLFVSTAVLSPSAGAMKHWDNPVFARVRPKCKGVIMMGCNTLSYRNVRLTLQRVFPNAVIIGYIDQTPASVGAYTPIDKVCRRDFFEKPPQKREAVEPVVKALNAQYRRRTLAVQVNNSVFAVHKTTGNVEEARVGDDEDLFFTQFGRA